MTVVTIFRSIQIAAPAGVVFAAMTDWSHQSEWMPGTSVKGVRRNGQGKGGTIVARTSIGPFGFNDPMTITKWQPPHICVVTHTGKVIKGTGAFLVEPLSPSRSTFIWSEDIKVPFGYIGKIGWNLAKIPFGFGLSWSLRRFKAWVESSSIE